MRKTVFLSVLALTAAWLAACSNQKEPAEKAVAQLEASLSQFRSDAEMYAATELKGVEDSIANLKGELARQNYKAVVMQTPTVTGAVTSLKQTVATKKAEAEEMLAAAQQEWDALSASLPEMVTRLQNRVDELNRSRRTPRGMDKAAFESAKQDFEALKSSWAEAGAEFSAGMAADAVRRARAAKMKGDRLVEKIGA
jgi:DNA repair exonuclease SbcCD ATPase subunit